MVPRSAAQIEWAVALGRCAVSHTLFGSPLLRRQYRHTLFLSREEHKEAVRKLLVAVRHDGSDLPTA